MLEITTTLPTDSGIYCAIWSLDGEIRSATFTIQAGIIYSVHLATQGRFETTNGGEVSHFMLQCIRGMEGSQHSYLHIVEHAL